MLLNHKDLTVQDAEVVATALGHFRKRPESGFPDGLVFEIARKAGHTPLGAFDRNGTKLEDAKCLLASMRPTRFRCTPSAAATSSCLRSASSRALR
jgi:hypothetical protein